MKRIRKRLLSIVMAMLVLAAVPEGITGIHTSVEVQAATVKLNKTSLLMCKGQKYTLKVSGTSSKVRWASSNKKIITVDSKGQVTAVSAGKAKIAAIIGSKRYYCSITVEAPAISKTTLTIPAGKTYTLKVSGTSKKAVWTTSNQSIAAVSTAGKISAKKPGTATITATLGSKKLTCKVTVKAASSPYDKLKKYITDKGYVNSEGNKYIYDTMYDEGTDFQWCIAYEKKTNRFEMVLLTDDGEVCTGIDMYITTKPSYVDPEFAFYYEDYDAGFAATAHIKQSTYKGQDVKFKIEETTGGVSYDIMNGTANATLKLAFVGWNEMIKATTGLTLRDFGFTVYK